MHPFYAYIQTLAPLTPAEWQQVEPALERFAVPKGEVILREGAVCRYLYFLESGLLRYYANRDGEEVTKYFTVAPYCFTAQQSFSKVIPADEAIEALADSLVWRIDRAATYQLLGLPGWSNFIRELIQEVQYRTDQLLVDAQQRSAEARYRDLLTTGDPLAREVPLKYLASFLGIAPQSLSRIRKRLVSGN